VTRRTPVTEEAGLRRRFRVIDTELDIGGRQLSILHPVSAEDLINEADFERDERLPYWAELWPSARVLAEQLLGLPGEGRTLLELGCGAGLVATSAALAGFRVCASDYYADALRFARVNAWRNGTGEIETRPLDWRRLPARLGRFDFVVASDVLYERAHASLVADVLAASLQPKGVALIADPGRVAAEDFVAAVSQPGRRLQVVARPTFSFVDGPVRQTITVFRIEPTG